MNAAMMLLYILPSDSVSHTVGKMAKCRIIALAEPGIMVVSRSQRLYASNFDVVGMKAILDTKIFS